MNTKTSRLERRNQQIADLIKRLHETEDELRHLTGGEVDAVVSDGGKTYLLREAQERLHQSAVVQKELAGMQKSILDALPAHIALVDAKGEILSVNEAWRHFAWNASQPGAPTGVGLNYLTICEQAQGIEAAGAREVAAGLRRVLSGEAKEFSREYPCRPPLDPGWFRLIITPLNENHAEGAVITHLDITERKMAELKTERLNRVYAILSQVNSVIAHVKDPLLLFEGCCHVAVDTGGMRAAWIGQFEAGTNRPRAVAKAGEIEGFLEEVQNQPRTARCPNGIVISQKRPVIINDIENDADYAPYRAAALARGYRSLAAFPLRLPNRIFGTMCLYSGQANFFDLEEVKLLDQFCNEISLAVKSFEQESQRIEAENTTRTSEARLRAVFEQAAVGICVIGLDYRFIRVNRRLCEITGYSEEEMLALDNCSEITFLDDRVAETSAFAKILLGQKSLVAERRCVRKDGGVIWARFTLSLLASSADRPRQFLGVVEDITARKESERQLTLLGTCVANLNDVVIVTEADLLDEPGPRIVFANRAFERVSGYKVSEITGRSPRFMQGSKTDRRTLKEIRQALIQKQPVRKEILNYAKDGTEYWVEIEIVPIFDASGKCTHFAGIEREITERKRNEEALRQKEQLLRMAGRLTRTGGWFMDVASRQVFWSDDVCDIMECPHGRSISLSDALDLHPNSSRDITTQALETCARTGTPFDIETEIFTTQGHRIWGRLCAEAERDEDGGVKRVWGAFQDITERKRSEEERDRLFNLSEDMLSIGSFDGRMVQVNPAWTRNLGWSAEELVSKPWLEFIHPDDHEVSMRAAEKLMRGRPIHDFENRYRARDGTYHWMSWNVHPLVEYRQMFGVTRDITERKNKDVQLRLLETCISSLNDVILICAAEDFNEHEGPYIVYVNPAFERLTGYSKAEAIGKRPPELLHGPKTDRAVVAHIHQTLKSGSPVQAEIMHYKKSGEEYWNAISIVPIFSPAGAITHFVSIERDITDSVRAREERKKHEEQLLWKTAFFEAQVNCALDGIVVVDNQGKKVLLNQRFADLWGLPQELIDDGEQAGRLQWCTELVKNSTAFADRVAYLYAHPNEISRDEIELLDGRVFDRYSAPVLGADGKYYGRIWTFRDITDRKRTMEVLQRSEARYRSLTAATAQIVWTTDAKGFVFGAMPEWQEFTGQSIEEVRGRGWAGAVHPEEAERALKIWEEAVKNSTIYETEFRLRRRDGIYRDFAVRGTPVLGSDGKILEWVGCCTDITEHKRADEQIAEQAALLDKAQDAIIVRDLDRNVQFWNKSAERMYGWMREEVVGRNIDESLFAEPEKAKEIQSVVLVKGEWTGEVRHRTKEGREVIVESSRTLIRDSAGRPKSTLAINTDITEKKKLEAQFMRAQRMESIGTLAGGVAHDLNNILAPIMMSIDILKTTVRDPLAEKTLRTIEVSAKRGADIVRQVLSFARGVEGERVEIQPKHLVKDLDHIIKDTFPKDILLKFSVPNDIWTILGDPTQVHQVLLNLCVNARDAMPNGGTLSLTVENAELDENYASMTLEAKPGRYVKISVADTGTGIPPDILDKIFEPFFTTKELNKGTGLGLSTVLAIVKSHEGVVNVYSELGRGTTFNVYLPATEASSTARSEKAGEGSLPRGNGEMILVVDDEASILTITSQTLEAFGYRVITAADGAEAVALYARHQNEIALVLTDMMMPVMDGPAMIHALMRLNPAVKVVGATGLNAGGSTARTAVAGVRHFLTKPYTARTLLKIMRTVLEED